MEKHLRILLQQNLEDVRSHKKHVRQPKCGDAPIACICDPIGIHNQDHVPSCDVYVCFSFVSSDVRTTLHCLHRNLRRVHADLKARPQTVAVVKPVSTEIMKFQLLRDVIMILNPSIIARRDVMIQNPLVNVRNQLEKMDHNRQPHQPQCLTVPQISLQQERFKNN